MPTKTDASDPRAAVKDLYDTLCEARMNMKYYGERLHFCQAWNQRMEIAMAVAASSSVLALAKGSNGLTVFLGLSTAILSILNTCLRLSTRIERLAKLWAGYQGVFTSAEGLVRDVQSSKCLDDASRRELRELHLKMDALCGHDDPCPSGEVLDRLQAEVILQYPPDNFWWPPRSSAA